MSERRTGLPERIRHEAHERVARPLNRRAFLAAGVASAIGVAAVSARPAAAASTGLTVYRLSADWGYPAGPKGKTRCACKACFRRADSAYFTTRAAAIDGRIHPCCVCQPYRTTIAGMSSAALFAGENSADIRDPRVAAVFAAVPTSGPAGEPNVPGSEDPAVAGVDGLDPPGVTSPSLLDPSGLPSAAMGFARTGSTLRLPLIGAALTAVGGALIAFRSRGMSAEQQRVLIPSRIDTKIDNQGDPS